MVYYHRQCQLKRTNQHLTTWLPEEFAQVNRVLKLKENGDWVDGWQVVHVGTRMDSESVAVNSRNYLHQREASDLKRGSREHF